jgi:hypothetical protein
MALVLLVLLLRDLVCVPLLKEWSLSFGTVATCFVRRRHGDLTLVILGLFGWSDARMWVLSQGVSSAPMGEQG